ncbi:hypothetical protein P9112_006848 [Eukaryota sp. TZLM1-RC]
MSDSGPQATIIIGRSSANEQQAPLDAASPPGGTNLGRRDSDSHLATNPQDSGGDPPTPAKDSSSPEEANADTSKEESTSTASKESKDSTGQVRPSSPSPKVSTPTQSKWQYTLEKFRRDLEQWYFLDLVALKAELATRAPKDHFEQFMIQMFLNESPPRIPSVEEDGDNFKFLLMPQPYDPLTHPDPECLMDFYPFRLDRESAVEPNPGQVFAVRSAYGQELSRVWNSLDNPPTLRSLPVNPETTPTPSRQKKVAVHGEDEDSNPCGFWVPRSQVLSPDPSIPKPLSGDLSVSDLDTSPPILLPSNAVYFDFLSMPKTTSESTTKIRDSPSRCFPTITRNPSKRLLKPLSTCDPESSHTNRIFSLSSVCANKSMNCPKFIELWLQINNIEVSGLIDSVASIFVISKDLSTKCKMEHCTESVKFIGVNGEPSNSDGNAKGILSFNVGSISKVVHLTKSLPIVPGNNILIIGIDILYELGLMNNDRVYIHLDELHRTLMLPESEFDHRISQTSDFKVSKTFEDHVNSSGCQIKLNNQSENQQLLATLEEFKDVFTLKPHEDGIDCNPMDIDFYDEDTVVYRPPRRLNPERFKIANQIFDELIKSGFATESNGRLSSPVVLVVYPDHRKPRPTGDFSGPNGVNANTIPIAPNLPKISDVLEFLSQANYIGTLDLPKAFWQLKINERDIEKTTLSIPGRSISFNRACFGLKNVPAVFKM